MKLPHLVLWIAAMALVPGASAGAGAPTNRVTTSVYVGRHFEVRDGDQPVKYVFNGQARVARVTGSLSTGKRLQRLRLREGWNLRGVAVEGSQLPSNGVITSALAWNSGTRSYAAVAAGQTLAAHSVLWIRAASNEVISLDGSSVEPASRTVPAGGTYVSAGLEAWTIPVAGGAAVWRWPGGRDSWQPTFTGELLSLGHPSPKLAVGEAAYVAAPNGSELPPPDPGCRIVYYHADHLGSASVVTDANGQPIEETANFPFGGVRHQTRWNTLETAYQFTQKERDQESGLQDFGHRYLHSGIGRWLSPDPLGEQGGGLNPYVYVNQNPLKHLDPNGAWITVTPNNPKSKRPTHYQIKLTAVFINSSSTKFTQQQLDKFAASIKATIEDKLKNEKGPVKWHTSVDLRVINDMKDAKDSEHVFQIVDKYKMNGAGEASVGGRTMRIASYRFTQLHPDQVDRTKPENKHYTLENYTSAEGTAMHEFGHVAGLWHDDTHDNLMQNGSIRRFDNKTVGQAQVEKIWKAYKAGDLNLSDAEAQARHYKK